MPLYRVTLSKTIHSQETWEVEADDEDEAVEVYNSGKRIDRYDKTGRFDIEDVKEVNA